MSNFLYPSMSSLNSPQHSSLLLFPVILEQRWLDYSPFPRAVGYFQVSLPLTMLLALPRFPFYSQKTFHLTSSAKLSSSPKQYCTLLHPYTVHTTQLPYICFYVSLFNSQGHIQASSLTPGAQFLTLTGPSTNVYWMQKYISLHSYPWLAGGIHCLKILMFIFSLQ